MKCSIEVIKLGKMGLFCRLINYLKHYNVTVYGMFSALDQVN